MENEKIIYAMNKGKKQIIEGYNKSKNIQEFVHTSKSSKTDGSFTKIGLRPQLGYDYFDGADNTSVFLSFGRDIALGEKNFLVKSILDDNQIEKISFDRITPNQLKEVIRENYSSELFLFISFDFELILINDSDDWGFDYDNVIGGNCLKLDGKTIPLYSVHHEIIGNNVIIFKKDYGRLKYVNQQEGSDEFPIHQEFSLKERVVDLTIYRLVKLTLNNKDKIKVISFSQDSEASK